MTKQLTYRELSALNDGQRVQFVEDFDIFPMCVISAGTVGVITENGLNEIYCCLQVKPDDQSLRDTLGEWDGNIHLGSELDPGHDPDDLDPQGWDALSPLALA